MPSHHHRNQCHPFPCTISFPAPYSGTGLIQHRRREWVVQVCPCPDLRSDPSLLQHSCHQWVVQVRIDFDFSTYD